KGKERHPPFARHVLNVSPALVWHHGIMFCGHLDGYNARGAVFLVVYCGVCVYLLLFLPSLCNIFAAISRLLMLLVLMVVLVLVSVAVLLVLLSLSRLLWTDPALRAITNPRAPRREGEADASQEHIKILENGLIHLEIHT
ncbi:unnamed protein product, partial [Ectocarpus sp. 8 AP-2014]